MRVFGRIRAWFWRLRWVLGVCGIPVSAALLYFLRHLPVGSEPIFYAYLQIAGSLLCFTFAANALVRFRGTHDRRTLILAFGFVLAGIIDTVAIFNFFDALASGGIGTMRVPLAWMVSRTLLALVLLAALLIDRWIPNSRESGREMGIALIVVAIVGYLTSAAYLGLPSEPAIYPHALIPRPWDLLLGGVFAAAAIGFQKKLARGASPFERIFCVAVWMNAVCQVVASQSQQPLDAPFTLAQLIKIGSYALILAGALLDNARLFAQVRHMAVTDPLTGLANYRTLINVLEAEIERSRRTGRSFALLLLDMDGLKALNDQHGHLVGSRALCRLAHVLRAHSRAMDTAARYGGDEFALVLPEAGAEAADSVTRRVRERVAEDGQSPHISVSVGSAVFPRDGQTIEDLFDAADSALYRMKGTTSGISTLARIAACL